MKILVYGINYFPELIGIGKYTTEMCEWLAENGDEVEVITGMPSYPNWKIEEKYIGKVWFTEIINKVKVHRCPLYVPENVTGATRIFHEISFGLSSLIFWVPRLFKRYDIILCVAPPLQLGLAGMVYKLFHKTLFIYHIQDLQLDAAKQLGLIKNKILLRIVEKFEKLILNQAHYISTISEGMIKKVVLKGIPLKKTINFKNWIDTTSMSPRDPNPSIKNSFGIQASEKVILYSGNIGEKQGIEIIVEAAASLQHTGAVFLIIGDGAFKNKLKDLVTAKGINNVKFFPLQPAERLCDVLNMADFHLVLQKKAAADLVMPSKLTAILSVGGVAIVSAESGTTLFDIIKENNMGILVEPENSSALIETIEICLGRYENKIKDNARQYALKNLDKQAIMGQFHTFVKNNI
jgi:colanic acid biosynthesis glycosyl transferase WcaI